MNAYVLSIGDELVLGQTVDTNSAYLSQQLAAIGCDVVAHKTVGDDQRAIEDSIREAVARGVDALIITGGIGPTEDDLTRQAIARVMQVELELNPEWLREMQGFFDRLRRPMPASNKIQAMIPIGAAMIWNTCGTAAGVRATIGKTELFAMPGVPKEMRAMFARDVLPWARQRAGGAVILQRTLHTFGAGESTIAERLGTLMMRQRNPSVGTTVSGGIVSLRINARFDSLDRAEAEMSQTLASCRDALGDLIFGQDEQTLAQVVSDLLKEKGVTVATAESCTGGLLAKMLTDVAGASRYFAQGWVTYTNESKSSQLGVSDQTLADHGAVSEPVVAEMASGARQRAGADVAIAISGIAGPDGGTDAKPVGTVCIGFAHAAATESRTFGFPGDREWVRDRTAKMALTILRFHLLGKRLPF
jgi:nicotinamide-nucleotide amidase